MASVTRILSPSDWEKRQIDTLKSVGEDNYKVGIAHPRKNPIEAGIAAEGKYADAMKKVVDEERRAKGLEGVTMAEWYGYTSNIGTGRLVEGVVKRAAKVRKFVTAYQPMLVDHVAKIDALDDVTDKDREDRMLENLRGLKALKGKA